MTWYEVLIRVGAALTVLTLAGAALAVVKASYNSARVKDLRETNIDLRSEVEDADRREEAHKLKELALETEIASLHNEVDLLTRMVTQRAAVEEVLDELKEHHILAMEQWKNMNTALDALLEESKSHDD
jgi:hypothetical protein